jgi:hypothetical protein
VHDCASIVATMTSPDAPAGQAQDQDLAVIYLLGAGNSGTTVLSMTLGGHREMVSLGEFCRLDREIAVGAMCSCGEPLRSCPFWVPVIAAAADAPAVPLQPGVSRHRLLRGSADEIFRHDPLVGDTVARNLQLYRAAKRQSGAAVLVDASKQPLHFLALHRSGRIRFVVVVVVRDVRGYMASALRRGGSASRSLLRWIGLNILTRFALRHARRKGSYVHVRFSDLLSNPDAVLERICEAAGLPYDPAMMTFHERPRHNVAGTRERFTPRPLGAHARKDDSLPLRARLAYALLGGPLWNRVFGA